VRAGAGRWTVRIAAAAEADLGQILQWTATRFGRSQAQIYAETLSEALAALTSGPSGAGVKRRDDIAKGVLTLHVAREGRKGRHFIVCRIGDEPGMDAIDVLRILHEAMDLPRHLTATRRLE
jgi:toxin ParE1/3/4